MVQLHLLCRVANLSSKSAFSCASALEVRWAWLVSLILQQRQQLDKYRHLLAWSVKLRWLKDIENGSTRFITGDLCISELKNSRNCVSMFS